MRTRFLSFCLALAAGALVLTRGPAWAAAPGEAASPPPVAQLLAQVAEARGGAAQWAAVQSMGWTGHIETDDASRKDLPFLMFFQRPSSTRFEVIQQTQRSVRVFDGSKGWKIRPGGERGMTFDDYSPEELAAARDACGLDGPLADPAAKGVAVVVEGRDEVEGHAAWRLRVTLPSGAVQHHWIDAASHRDLRYDRVARDRSGHEGVLTVWLRDYQTIGGLTLPMQVETRLPDGRLADRLVIEKLAINPVLAADTFSAPETRPIETTRHGGVIVNATGGSAAHPGH